VKYRFTQWDDGSVNPQRTLTVNQDVSVVATYGVVTHLVRFQSTPIAVQATVDGQPVQSGQTIEVPEGATITITVPREAQA
jgi:hypothetical protein